MAQEPLDSDQLIAAIDEFYMTTDESRRHEIDTVLCRFKTDYECVLTVGACMRIISRESNSSRVKYFGAMALYDVIKVRSEECIANPTLQMSVKTFLVDCLSSGAYVQTTSILNKLSAALALFSLYCIPEIWQTPVEDFTQLFAVKPEILLKVLSDMAAEFPHVTVPLTQRSKLKAELHRFSENIIQVLAVVLRGGDTSSITKQAAVECVEQWLRLPGIALDQWTHVLSDVLGAVVQDCTALSSILDIISENDEFHKYSMLIINICQYICVHVSGKIEEELREDSTSEEIVTLVAATCSVAEKSIPTLVECAAQGGDSELIIRMSQMMQVLANLPGQYPLFEMVSDLPSSYFIFLRNEMMQTSKSKGKFHDQLHAQLAQIYAEILDVAIKKLTYPTIESWFGWSLYDREIFEAYRKTRSEVSYDSYHFSPADTLNFLNQKMGEAITAGDVNTTEACLFQWECVADYLDEKDYPAIIKCLEMCASSHFLMSEPSNVLGRDLDRRGATLMGVLYALSHLIQDHERQQELECALIPVILSYVSPKVASVREAINTLEKFVENRPGSLDIVGDQVSTACYEFFNNTSPKTKDADRLAALKCIGHVLSRKRPSETMVIIEQILSHQNIDEAGVDNETRHGRYAFQINIFSVLFSSLSNRKFSAVLTAAFEDEEPTNVQLLKEAIPVFENLCSGSSVLDRGKSGSLIQEVCKAVRSALTSLPDRYLPSFFPFVVSLLNSALFVPESVVAACALAKSAVLQCGPLVGVDMANAFAHWMQAFEQQMESNQLDEYLQVIYHVVKKSWKIVRKFEEPSMVAFRSAIKICNFIITNSSIPTDVRSASQILAALASYSTSHDDGAMKAVFAEDGPTLLRAVFGRIQGELMRPTVEALAEVLFFYFKEFTTETRALINAEPYGASGLITAMFREIGNPRNFKQQAIRFNLAAIRDPGFFNI